MQTALVTGVTGGIGGAIARRLVAEGYHVLGAGRSLERARAFAQGVNANELVEGRCTPVELDVTSGQSAEDLFHGLGALGVDTVHWLINNAGVADTAPGAHESNHALTRRLMEVNFYGPVRLFALFAPKLLSGGPEDKPAGMIQVASSAGLQGYPYASAYAASKHALLGWTRSIALECAPKGVTVAAVCPHYVDTPMTDRNIETMMRKSGRSEADLREFLSSQNPGGILVTPEDVADATLDLMNAGRGGMLLELPGGSRRTVDPGVQVASPNVENV